MKRVCFSLITRRIGVFSGPYFPVFGQNTKNYRVNFKIFPWVFPDFSNFPLIFQVFPECCKSWVFPQTYCIKIPTFQGFFLDHNERLKLYKGKQKRYKWKKLSPVFLLWIQTITINILNKQISLTLKQKQLQRKCFKEKIKRWLKINT